MRDLALCLVVLLFPASRLEAQNIVELPDGSVMLLGGGRLETAPVAAAPEAEGADDEEAAEPSPRIEKFKKLVFDRRPSVILQTWSTPPEPEEPDEEAAEEVETEQAPSEEPTPADPELSEQDPAEGATEAPSDETPAEATEELDEEAQKAAEEAAKAEAEAAAAAEKAAAEAALEAERKAAEEKAIEAEMKAFQRNVTLGDWATIRTYFAGLTEEEVKAAYDTLLAGLVKGPPKARNQYANWSEKNTFSPLDIHGLCTLSPFELEMEQIAHLGTLLRQCTGEGGLIEEVVHLLQQEAGTEEPRLPALDSARVLFAATYPLETGAFLPTPEEAEVSEDRGAMNLVARYHLAFYEKEKKLPSLEISWRMTQAALAEGDIEEDEKKDALKRAVDIAPRIREELGNSWLEESFTERPERGMEILSVIGGASSGGLVALAKNQEERLEFLQLQATAANALLEAAPELATTWASTLELLAGNWLREAEYSYQNDQSTSLGPSLQRDTFGNFFYYNYNSRSFNNRNAPTPIVTAELLEVRPSDPWLAHVSDGLRPKYAMVLAQLYLKVKEEALSFPYIERLAQEYPERAEDLVAEFLRVWTANHDPNTSSNRTSSYMFIYGFEQRANAIPLTRSKQERNLVELSGWIGRLRKLPVEIDEQLIADAFTKIHSTAEVYRLETIEQVFGSMDSLEPETLAELAQKMRSNLVGVWRNPNVQKDAKTNRRQKDIEREVLRGYAVTAEVLEKALADHPDSWPLVLARASVLHDENNYRQEIERFSEFSSKRMEALGEFARAAALYREQVGELDLDDETTRVYEHWFYATLGACDLNAITHEMHTAESQLELIRQDMEAIGGEAGERHVSMFANTLFTRMSSVNPAVKFRYVRSGLGLVGDNERAREAREVYEYYADLVTEIQLETQVDGSDQVGKDEPFGVYVNLRHTREIEREAGGFSKYLINQNNQSYGFNYGRPTENYRDKFEEAARELLSEHFEVLSITFNHPDTNSRAEERYGWRITPYAYLLLKAKGPQVDKLPSLRLDLDFLDTTGYAVLPVESPPLPIDAGTERIERPFEDLELVQTLDERQASEGKLVLEIQARSAGLVPDLGRIVDLSPEGFQVTATDDQGVSVTKFDEESSDVRVLCDRTWLVTLQAADELAELPKTFEFAAPLTEEAKVEYQRYVDADLETVERVVPLEARYGTTSGPGLLTWGLGLLALGAAGFLGLRTLRGGTAAQVDQGLRMPDPATPFTVIGLLRQIEATGRLKEAQRDELRAELDRLEGHYFRGDGGAAPDLEGLARTWLQRAG